MPDSTKADSQARVKKPYSSPQLAVYGDIRDITQTVFSFKGAADGMPGFYKTGGDV